jgi:beta-1,4-N-acetylgalactosaminyltransferase 2
VVQGRGKKQLTISTSDQKLLKFILQHVTYTSTGYQHHRVDMGESLSLNYEMLGR